MPLVLSNREVAQALDAHGYVEAMEEAFRELGRGMAVNALRNDTCIPVERYTPEIKRQVDDLIRELPDDADPVYASATMAAAKARGDATFRLKTVVGGYPQCGVAAVRISTHFDTQPEIAGTLRRVKLPLSPGWTYTSMVVLLSVATGEVLGMLPDSHIQKMRVGATTAVGVRYMARDDSSRVGLLGSGAQAEAALECVACVRPIKRADVYSPTAENRRRFARDMSGRLGIDVVAVDSAEQAFREADIILTATSSYQPVFEPHWLRQGMHLGIGTLLEDHPGSFALSPSIVVSLRPFGGDADFVRNYVMGEPSKQTFGQLINRTSRKFDWDSMTELGELLNSGAPGRQTRGDITHHINNNGCGMQFAAAGARILENAKRMRLGFELPTGCFVQKEHT